MATSYDDAVATLYQGALDAFVAERKRLAGELKAGGDKEGAARLAKLGRPSISAWTVNQLFWHDRDAFERLLASAARLRRGDHDAGAEHQRALAALRALAAERLTAGGHAAPEATLRRVTTTLSALAAAGGFDPDPPGALVADRDPPGFETFGSGAAIPERKAFPEPAKAPPKASRALHAVPDAGDAKRREEAERKRLQEEQERKRAAEERRLLAEAQARKRAERERLTAALSAARADAVTHRRDVERLRHELSTAERKLEKADASVAELKAALAELE
jgi:hypothetical protein